MIDASKVKPGDIVAVLHYAKVSAKAGNKVSVTDLDTGLDFDIQGAPLIERCLTGDQYTTTKKVSKTEAAELLVHAFNKPIKLAFEKTDGSLREMRCRLVQPEHLLGRSMVEDLDISATDPKGRMRQADHRTLKWLVIDGTRYEVKK